MDAPCEVALERRCCREAGLREAEYKRLFYNPSNDSFMRFFSPLSVRPDFCDECRDQTMIYRRIIAGIIDQIEHPNG
jgi:hypothetical protein